MLAACSSQAAAPAHITPPSAAVLAKRLGCAKWQPTVPPGLFTREEGACVLRDGRQVVLATFGNAAGQKAWARAETALGGILVQGTRWAANAPLPADAHATAVKLGGRITG